jgi:hypothetical protein
MLAPGTAVHQTLAMLTYAILPDAEKFMSDGGRVEQALEQVQQRVACEAGDWIGLANMPEALRQKDSQIKEMEADIMMLKEKIKEMGQQQPGQPPSEERRGQAGA